MGKCVHLYKRLLNLTKVVMGDSDSDHSVKKPSLFWLLTEGSRALAELSTYLPYTALKTRAQNGDGHPVIVFPGFMASDASTKPLRIFLDKLGYNSYGWDIGRNFGDPDNIEILAEQVESIYRSHLKKVTIIGWSLGGVYARQVAKEIPHITRQVITLGSPFRGLAQPNNAVWLYELITNGDGVESIDPQLLADIAQPAPVPTTAIYSKEDGVVPWQACIEDIETAIHQNVQVRGSHFGLGVNPIVLDIIADRLRYGVDNWRKWAPDGSLPSKLFYPNRHALQSTQIDNVEPLSLRA